MNAIILCGGFGNRLKPLTDQTPKPLLPVANLPILDYSVSHLYGFGIRDYVFTLAYRPEAVIEYAIGYIGNQCRFSVETVPLGTLGGIKESERFLDDAFIVTSGDIIENIDFAEMARQHFDSGALVTAAVTEVDDPSAFGVYETDEAGKVTGFTEKPAAGTERSKLAGCGVYIMNKSVLQRMGSGVKMDIALDLLPSLVEKGELYTFVHHGFWRDCGTPESYFLTNFEMADGPFYQRAPHRKSEAFDSFRTAFGEPAVTAVSAVTDGSVRGSIIGPGARIERDAEVERCVVMPNVTVGGRYQNCIVGHNFSIPIEKVPYKAYSSPDSALFLK